MSREQLGTRFSGRHVRASHQLGTNPRLSPSPRLRPQRLGDGAGGVQAAADCGFCFCFFFKMGFCSFKSELKFRKSRELQ